MSPPSKTSPDPTRSKARLVLILAAVVASVAAGASLARLRLTTSAASGVAPVWSASTSEQLGAFGSNALISDLANSIAPVVSNPPDRKAIVEFLDARLRGIHAAQRELGEKAALDHGFPRGTQAFYDPSRIAWVVEVASVASKD